MQKVVCRQPLSVEKTAEMPGMGISKYDYDLAKFVVGVAWKFKTWRSEKCSWRMWALGLPSGIRPKWLTLTLSVVSLWLHRWRKLLSQNWSGRNLKTLWANSYPVKAALPLSKVKAMVNCNCLIASGCFLIENTTIPMTRRAEMTKEVPLFPLSSLENIQN